MRPNILFLMSDEHRADVAGWAGNDVIRTPLLDSLAESGVVFTNAYTPSPICVPGRQAMMAGQLPSTCGCRVYGDDLPPDSMTFARRFAQAGYETVCCGKLHHMGPDQMQGWTQRPVGDLEVAPRYREGLDGGGVPRPGQRDWKEVKWSDAKEIKRAGIGTGMHVARDAEYVDTALQVIERHFTDVWYDRAHPDAPLLLKVSLLQPHYPYLTDEERFTRYLNRVEPFEDIEPLDHPFLSQRRVRVGEDASAHEVRRAVAAYYGMIDAIDAQFARVITQLEHVGQNLDDWIIIYTSDHGEMLGEHGIWEKQKFYEGSVRVPLIIRWPEGLPGGVEVEENVSLIDLFATLCELCDVPAPPGLDSRSLVPLLRGNSTDWDDEVVSQFGRHNLMIKRHELKYQWYGPQMPEVLFDLARDPGETTNAVDDARYAEALARFRRRRDELGYGDSA